MKWVPALWIAFAVSALVIAVLSGAHPLAVLVIALPGFTLGLAVTSEAVRRDRAVRALVVRAFSPEKPVLPTSWLVQALGTPDVKKAYSDHLKREEARMAERYQNGDASDF